MPVRMFLQISKNAFSFPFLLQPSSSSSASAFSLAVLLRNKYDGIICLPQLLSDFLSSVQFSSVTQLCPTLCNPMNCSTPSHPVHHQLPEPTQTHVHWVSDATQPSHPLSSTSPPVLNLSWHQALFQWVSSLHQVAKILAFQLQHQSFQWTPRINLL